MLAVDMLGRAFNVYKIDEKQFFSIPESHLIIDGEYYYFCTKGKCYPDTSHRVMVKEAIHIVNDNLKQFADKAQRTRVNIDVGDISVSVRFKSLFADDLDVFGYITVYTPIRGYTRMFNPIEKITLFFDDVDYIAFVNMPRAKIMAAIRYAYFNAINLDVCLDSLRHLKNDVMYMYKNFLITIENVRSKKAIILKNTHKLNAIVSELVNKGMAGFIDNKELDTLLHILNNMTDIAISSGVADMKYNKLKEFAKNIGVKGRTTYDLRYNILKQTDHRFRSYAEVYEKLIEKIKFPSMFYVNEQYEKEIEREYNDANNIVSDLYLKLDSELAKSEIKDYVDYIPNKHSLILYSLPVS